MQSADSVDSVLPGTSERPSESSSSGRGAGGASACSSGGASCGAYHRTKPCKCPSKCRSRDAWLATLLHGLHLQVCEVLEHKPSATASLCGKGGAAPAPAEAAASGVTFCATGTTFFTTTGGGGGGGGGGGCGVDGMANHHLSADALSDTNPQQAGHISSASNCSSRRVLLV